MMNCRSWRWLALVLAGLWMTGCGAAPQQKAESAAGNSQTAAEASTPAASGNTLTLTSSEFMFGETMPARYTGEGEEVSPPLSWSGVPPEAKTLVLICEDPDAPSPQNPNPEPWVHWVIYNIPATQADLPEGISRVPAPNELADARQGQNSFSDDNIGYRGPMPPPGSGSHRYFFRLFALDTEIDLAGAVADKQSITDAMAGHVVAQAELMAVYQRP